MTRDELNEREAALLELIRQARTEADALTEFYREQRLKGWGARSFQMLQRVARLLGQADGQLTERVGDDR